MPALRLGRPPLALVAALVLVFACAGPAEASWQFSTKWGGSGSGDGQFNQPLGVATDSSDNVYVPDQGNNRVQKFTSNGAFLTKWGSSGIGDGQFNHPVGVATDGGSNVYVVDSSNSRIQKFSSTGTFLTKWGSYGSGDGQFSSPLGVAVDRTTGDVYVADGANSRVQKFSSTGTFLTKWGSPGSGDGQFNGPQGVAVDSSGNVYVSDAGNNRVQKFSSTATFLTKWGGSGAGDGQFNHPFGVAISGGSVYVADAGNNRIQQFSTTGAFVDKFGSAGSGNGQFNGPAGVATGSPLVWVADQLHDDIQEFKEVTPSGPPPAQCSVRSFHQRVATHERHRGGVEPIWGLHQLGDDEYAVYRGVKFEFAAYAGLTGSCPDLDMEDVLPTAFDLSSAEETNTNQPHEVEVIRSFVTILHLKIPATTWDRLPLLALSATGKFTRVSDAVNQPQINPLAAMSTPLRVHVVEPWVVEHLDATARSVVGVLGLEADEDARANATAAASSRGVSKLSKPKRVKVSVRRLGGRHGRRCTYLRSRKGRFKRTRRKGGVCKAIWLTAHGTKHWKLRFARRLPRGRYLVQARVVDVAGVSSDPARAHRRFRVR